MNEMNRRDYLKRMGLATAVTIGSKHLAGLSTIASTRDGSSNLRPAGFPTGSKPTPSVFTVKLIFVGMAIFGYKDTEAHVAFHRGHPETHKMKVIVSEVGRPSCSDIYEIGDGTPPQQARFRQLEVGIRGKSSDANFFLGRDFDREHDMGDELDFRWLPDLEGPDVYDHPLNNIKDVFNTRLVVKHGTFYTYQRTKATFRADNGTPKKREFGHLAKLMATNIGPLNNGEEVYLTVGGQDVLPFPLTNAGKYEIYFFNERPHPTGTDNDFEMVYDALRIDPGDKFKLVRVGRGAQQSTDLCHDEMIDKKQATDEAPCMGASFSSGGGLPN
jgi:hypothetical protein